MINLMRGRYVAAQRTETGIRQGQRWFPTARDLRELERHATDAYEARKESGTPIGGWVEVRSLGGVSTNG